MKSKKSGKQHHSIRGHRSSYFKDYYVKLFNDYELFNGFVSTIGVEYHIRQPLKTIALQPPVSERKIPLRISW